MPNQEQQNDDAGVAHCAARKTCDLIIAFTLVLHRTCLLVQHGQRIRRVNMQHGHGQQSATKDPQHGLLGKNWIQQLLKEVRVVVEVALTHVHLQVADHVEEHKAQQTNTGDRHDVLLANGCSI